MGTHARIEPGGYVTIDVGAWLEHRTGGPDDDLTSDLRAWAARHDDDGRPTAPGAPIHSRYRNWVDVTRSWATARGHEIPEPDLIGHAETRLDAEVWILRATITGRYKVAAVGINHDPPTVHAESCTDPYDWFDADTVEIGCPAGHGWTWRTGRELIDGRTGSFTTLTAVFGADLDAPFTPCPRCTAHQHGAGREPCPCDGAPWIICPIPGCGRRCDVELPAY
jgi:hypothetical protein